MRRPQKRYRPPSKANLNTHELLKIGQKIRRPDADNKQKHNVLIKAHVSEAGHRGMEALKDVLCGTFEWKDIKGDVREFAQGFLLCIVLRAERKIPRPLGTNLHVQKINKVFYMDFLYVGNSDKDVLR